MSTIIRPISDPIYSYARAHLQHWVDVLAACGWVQSNSAGQVDIATAPIAAGSVGTLIFESTDALSAVLPIYIKVYFNNLAHGSYQRCFASSIGVSFELDKATGNLTGAVRYFGQCQTSSSYPSGRTANWVPSIFASGDGGSLRICEQPGAFAYMSSQSDRGVHPAFFIAIARTKDVDGNPTADGVLVCAPETSWSSTVRPMTMTFFTPEAVFYAPSRSLCPFLTEGSFAGSSSPPSAGQVASVGGLPQMQHPWACTPRLYPFEDVAYFSHFAAAAIGDTMDVQVGAATKKYLFLGRTGTPPSTVGAWGGTSINYDSNADMWIDAGIAILWE